MNKIAVKEEEGGLLRPVVGSTDDRMSLGRKMIYGFDISVKGNQKKVCNRQFVKSFSGIKHSPFFFPKKGRKEYPFRGRQRRNYSLATETSMP